MKQKYYKIKSCSDIIDISGSWFDKNNPALVNVYRIVRSPIGFDKVNGFRVRIRHILQDIDIVILKEALQQLPQFDGKSVKEVAVLCRLEQL